MSFEPGNLVTRKSYDNDVIFKIEEIENDNYILKGVNVRLCADSPLNDLVLYDIKKDKNIEDDDSIIDKMNDYFNIDRNDYFYLPGRILHVDGDNDYLKRCLKFYKNGKVNAFGIHVSEENMPSSIKKHLEDIRPDILVITGHDAYYRKNGDKNDIKSYRNTDYFVKTVQEARNFEKAHDKLIIIAGGCQSNFDALIKAGANFASSPKRINIHALDPAIIALMISLSDKGQDIDLLGILDKTKHGASGMGGLITKGTMYIGYPR